MSQNEDVIYIFVKGNKGRFASEITNYNFASIHQITQENVLNENKERMSPIHADIDPRPGSW